MKNPFNVDLFHPEPSLTAIHIAPAPEWNAP